MVEKHNLHLEPREGRAQTTADAAAKRNPAVGLGSPVEEALGPKRRGIRRVELRVVLDDQDRDRELSAWLELVAVELGRLRRRPEYLGNDGASPERLS